jgi:hypothetical protein
MSNRQQFVQQFSENDMVLKVRARDRHPSRERPSRPSREAPADPQKRPSR